ncbi:nucleotidyltransferase family protein [Streptomyces sp. NPDC127098]|uniref:nucleotidyltransferase family protein n=1 Tax=Streptomyces sp. NPDC127098 TaxID=3347137 RepID=UPI003652ABFB
MLKASTLRGLRPEDELLLALARLRLTTEEKDRIRSFLAAHEGKLDWGRFIDQAARHMVLPIVGRNLSRNRLTHAADGRPLMPYRWIYADVYEANRLRTALLTDEYGKVLRGLNDAGLPYLIRKGPVLGEHVYLDPAARRVSNLDVFLRRDDFAVYADVAAELGYDVGAPSVNGQRITPFDRRTELYFKTVVTNSSLPFMKVGNSSLVDMYILTGISSLFQPTTGLTNDVEELLDRSLPTTLYGVPARMLDRVDQILDACVQVHVRATMLYYIESGKDLTLRNFLDLIAVLESRPDDFVEEFEERVRRFDCADSVYYSLHHAGLLYPAFVPEDLVERFRPTKLDYLDEYGGFDGGCYRWQKPFAKRLFDTRRAAEVTARSAVPGPRSVV